MPLPSYHLVSLRSYHSYQVHLVSFYTYHSYQMLTHAFVSIPPHCPYIHTISQILFIPLIPENPTISAAITTAITTWDPPARKKKKSSGRILRRGLLFGLPRPEIPTGEGCVRVSERTGTQTAFFQDFFGFLLKEFLSDFSLRIEMGFQGGDFSDFLKEGK